MDVAKAIGAVLLAVGLSSPVAAQTPAAFLQRSVVIMPKGSGAVFGAFYGPAGEVYALIPDPTEKIGVINLETRAYKTIWAADANEELTVHFADPREGVWVGVFDRSRKTSRLLHFSPSGARLGSIQLPATLGTYLYWAVADGTLWLFYDQKAILAKVSLTHGLVGTEHVAPYYRMFINAGSGHLLFFNDSAVIFGSANVPFRSVKTVLGDFRGAQISSATIMPDGEIRFSLAGGTIVHITSSGEVMRCALPPDVSEIVSMASVANGDWVASNNGDISFYTNTCVQRYRHHTGYYGGPLSLALSKTQTSLVFVSRDRNAIVELGLPKQ